jgi:hypothetical protein
MGGGWDNRFLFIESHTYNVELRFPHGMSPLVVIPASSRNLNGRLIRYCCVGTAFLIRGVFSWK